MNVKIVRLNEFERNPEVFVQVRRAEAEWKCLSTCIVLEEEEEKSATMNFYARVFAY